MIEIAFLDGLHLFSTFVYMAGQSQGLLVDKIVNKQFNIPCQTVRSRPVLPNDAPSIVHCYLVHVLSDSSRDIESLILRILYASELDKDKPVILLVFNNAKVPDLMIADIEEETERVIQVMLYTDLEKYLSTYAKIHCPPFKATPKPRIHASGGNGSTKDALYFSEKIYDMDTVDQILEVAALEPSEKQQLKDLKNLVISGALNFDLLGLQMGLYLQKLDAKTNNQISQIRLSD